MLLGASLVFYGWGEPKYIILMMILIGFNYLLVLKMDHRPQQAKIPLIIAITVNLMGLVIFKYYGFIVDSISHLFSLPFQSDPLPLPIGISFYTFQILSYVIDVYLGKIKPQKSLIQFALYVAMFPQLVAGPIVKYSDIQTQLVNRNENLELFGKGVERFIQGLGKKVLLANNIGQLWITIQGTPISNLSVLTAWLGIVAFTFQIYFDFSGYSDMAIGLGKMFGFELKENFDYPYMSQSITEFWRRWHISLGGWFREYVYIPLGGNRRGIKRQVLNIFVVWLLTGLWHGASWNFVVWGLYYGVILWFEKCYFKKILTKLSAFGRHVYTMLLVMIGWTFFSLDSFSEALAYLRVMFKVGDYPLYDSLAHYELSTYGLLLILLFVCSTPYLHRLGVNLITKAKAQTLVALLGLQILIFLLCLAYLVTTTYNPFLYFRF